MRTVRFTYNNIIKEKKKMKKTIILAIISVLALCSCARFSHNVSGVAVGKEVKIGSPEYGELLYLDGFSLVDFSRENSEWQIDINDSDGISFDPATQTLKGVKSIRRRIGKQVTGYLNDLADKSPEAAIEYLRGDVMFHEATQNKTEIKEDTTFIKSIEAAIKKARDAAKKKSGEKYKPKYIIVGDEGSEFDFSTRDASEQLAIAKELRDFDYIDKNEKREDPDNPSKHENVIDFIARTDYVIKTKGWTTLDLWISHVKIGSDKKLEEITFLRQVGENEIVEEPCVRCDDVFPEIPTK